MAVTNLKCEGCSELMVTSDSGYYCSNERCGYFDQDIDAYENDGIDDDGM